MIIRRLLQGLLIAAALSAPALAEYPEKPITYVIPYNPGGESDVTARFQEAHFADVAGQDVVIQYKPGAGGASAWAQLNSMPDDGYTIMNVNFPHAILQPSMMEVGYQTDDVMPAYIFHYTPDAIVVRADSPYQSLEDMIADAKANPGALTFGGSGTNSANHLAAVRFDSMTEVTSTYIPFKGSAPSMAALLGGQIKAAMTYTTQGIKAGDQVRVLAIATEERLPSYPDVPTFTELGFDYIAGAYRGVTLPKSAPDEVRSKLSDIIGEINQLPDFRDKMEEAGFVLIDVPADEMVAWIEARQEEYSNGIEALKASQ